MAEPTTGTTTTKKAKDFKDGDEVPRHKPTTDERLSALEALAGIGPGSAGYQAPAAASDDDEGGS